MNALSSGQITLTNIDDTYSILLTNEAQVIPTNKNGYPLSNQSYTTTVMVLQGAFSFDDFRIGEIRSANGIIVSVVDKTITFSVNQGTQLIGDSGLFNIPITVNGSEFIKTFSWACSKQGQDGANGQNGASAKFVNIIPTSQVFKLTGEGEPSPTQIKLLPNLQNTTYKSWKYSNDGGSNWIDVQHGSNGLTIEDSTLVVSHDSPLFNINSLVSFKVLTNDVGIEDVISISKLYDGANGSNGESAKYVILSSEQVFKYSNNFQGTPTPTSIDVVSRVVGYQGRPKLWQYKRSGGEWTSLNFNGDTYTLRHDNNELWGESVKSITIRCTVEDSYDEVTIVKVSDGANGQDGQDGLDGVSIIDIKEQYYLSDSQQELIGGQWLDKTPTWIKGKYIWTRTIFTYSNETTKTTNPICVTGKDGEDGLNGGVSVTHVDVFYYQSISSTELIGGSWSTTAPAWVSGKYVWSKTITYLDNSTQSESEPICITGEKGQTGTNGQDGIDGVNSYFFVRYSANADGNPMTETPQLNTKYMGTCSIQVNQAPALHTSYQWSLIKGADGANGVPGAKGEDGRTSYLHIKYSNDGLTFTPNNGEDLGKYIGTYVDFTKEDSNIFGDYTWKKYVGEDGQDSYSIILTNESHTFPCEADGSIASELTTQTSVVVYKGSEVVTPSYENVVAPQGMLVERRDSTYTIKALKGSTLAPSGSFNIVVDIDGITLSKTFSWAKAKKGQNGQNGTNGSNGKDGCTILLTNEAQVIPTDKDRRVGSKLTFSTEILAYMGSLSKNFTIGEVVGSNGIVVSKTTTTINFTINSGTVLESDFGTINIPIIIDGVTYNKAFSWSCSKQGNNGQNGANAKTASIIASSQIFKSTDGGKTFTPNTIILTPNLSYVTYSNWQYSTNGGATWNPISSGSNGLTISGNVLTISKDSKLFTQETTSIVFRLNTNDPIVYDTITIVKIYDIVDLTQEDIFNKLTNNGQTQGIYLDGGKIYINGQYIKAGTVVADIITSGTFKGVNFEAGGSGNDGTIIVKDANNNTTFLGNKNGVKAKEITFFEHPHAENSNIKTTLRSDGVDVYYTSDDSDGLGIDFTNQTSYNFYGLQMSRHTADAISYNYTVDATSEINTFGSRYSRVGTGREMGNTGHVMFGLASSSSKDDAFCNPAIVYNDKANVSGEGFFIAKNTTDESLKFFDSNTWSGSDGVMLHIDNVGTTNVRSLNSKGGLSATTFTQTNYKLPIEVGRYIDLHNADSMNDVDVRIETNGTRDRIAIKPGGDLSQGTEIGRVNNNASFVKNSRSGKFLTLEDGGRLTYDGATVPHNWRQSFTPFIFSDTGNFSMVEGWGEAVYLGDLVWVRGRVRGSRGGNSGTVNIGGLPVGCVGGYPALNLAFFGGIQKTLGYDAWDFKAYIEGNSSHAILNYTDKATGGWHALQCSHLITGNVDISFSATYRWR